MAAAKSPEDRAHPRQIRMTEADYIAAVADARAAGMTFSDYVRHLLERARKPSKVKR